LGKKDERKEGFVKRNLWIFGLIVLFFLLILMGRRMQYVFLLYQNTSGGSKVYHHHPIVQNKSFVILLIAYGDASKAKDSLRSIFEQNYRNFRILLINQNGLPLSLEKEFIEKNHQKHRVTFLEETREALELQNIYNAIACCQNHEIVLIVREGDLLAHNRVLFSLNQVYANPDIWLSYGKHLHFPSYLPSSEKPFTVSEIVKRKQRKRDSFDFGLKSFYAGLFKKIALQDLMDSAGFYFSIEDCAMMMPMIEMASSHIAYLPEIHYLERSTKDASLKKTIITNFIRSDFFQAFKKSAVYPLLEHPPYKEENKDLSLDLVFLARDPEHLLTSLESIQENTKDITDIFVIIPWRKKSSFEKVAKKFPCIIFIEESPKNLKSSLLRQVLSRSMAKFLLLSTDHYVLERKVDLKECAYFLSRTKARGFYLGLGEDARYCSRGGFDQVLPRQFFSLREGINAWQCHESECGDWAFPDGFVMGLYEKDSFKKMIESLHFKNLKELEKNWSLYSQEKRIGLCPSKSYVRILQDSSGFIKGK
jgi:hypothetical protein